MDVEEAAEENDVLGIGADDVEMEGSVE